MYIWLVEKIKENIKTLLLIVSIILILRTNNLGQWIGIVLIIIAAWLFQDTFRDFLKTILTLGIIALATLLIYNWWNKTNFFGREVTDSTILILITGLYSIFTYMILHSNKESFEMSRLPLIYIYTVADSIAIVNESTKSKAENIELKIEFVYPIPNTKIEKIKQKIKRLYLNYKGYEIRYRISEIPPSMTKYASFEIFLKDILKLPKLDFQGNQDMIEYHSETPLKFQINVMVSYQTDTGYKAPKDIMENFVFYCDTRGCNSMQSESKILRIK